MTTRTLRTTLFSAAMLVLTSICSAQFNSYPAWNTLPTMKPGLLPGNCPNGQCSLNNSAPCANGQCNPGIAAGGCVNGQCPLPGNNGGLNNNSWNSGNTSVPVGASWDRFDWNTVGADSQYGRDNRASGIYGAGYRGVADPRDAFGPVSAASDRDFPVLPANLSGLNSRYSQGYNSSGFDRSGLDWRVPAQIGQVPSDNTYGSPYGNR
ncbi:MAG: hypothetical protein KDA85_19185, partial [Planctomycetaceae bacterium]|nr:hypothetical protein [Planctomycetaceae bacterium]